MRILPSSAVLPPFGWPSSGRRRGQRRISNEGTGWAGWAGMPLVKGGLMSWQGPAVVVGPTNWSWITVSRTSGCELLQG